MPVMQISIDLKFHEKADYCNTTYNYVTNLNQDWVERGGGGDLSSKNVFCCYMLNQLHELSLFPELFDMGKGSGQIMAMTKRSGSRQSC